MNASLLMILTLALIYSVATRIPLELNIIRDRNALYKETVDGLVENIYTLKLINMDTEDHQYQLRVDGLKDLIFIDNTNICNIFLISKNIFRKPNHYSLKIPIRFETYT